MNNVELARTLSWRENALFEEREKNVPIKSNEQCRACPNIVMATKRTFWGTREERLAWHLYQLVIIQGVVCPPKFQVLCAWCLQNFSWLYGLKQRYGAVSNRNRLSLQTLQFVSLSSSPVVIMSAEAPSNLKKDSPMWKPSFGMKRWQIKEKAFFL